MLEVMLGEIIDEEGGAMGVDSDGENEAGDDDMSNEDDELYGEPPVAKGEPVEMAADEPKATNDSVLLRFHTKSTKELSIQKKVFESLLDIVRSHRDALCRVTELVEAQEQRLKPASLSLVAKEEQVFFVWWDDGLIHGDVNSYLGWRVRLDTKNRVVYTLPYKKTRESFKYAEVLLYQMPAIMLKATGAGRCDAPSWVVHWWQHMQARFYSGPLETFRPHRKLLPDILNECVLCHAAQRHSCTFVAEDHADMFVCASCCSMWHRPCALLFEGSKVFEPATHEWAMALDRFTCPLCEVTE